MSTRIPTARYDNLQKKCVSDTDLDQSPYGVDPAFKKGSSFYSADNDAAEAARVYPCAASATYTAAGGANPPPFCKELFSAPGVPYAFQSRAADDLEDGFPVFFDVNLSEDNARRWMQYVREAFLIDERARSVSARLVTYNAESLYFGSARVDFQFQDSGSIEVTKDVGAVRVENYRTNAVRRRCRL